MKVFLKVSRVIDRINLNIGRLSAFLLLPMIFLTTSEVFCRYVLNNPTIWAWELILQLWAALLMFCGGYCYLRGNHVRVDVVYNMFPDRAKLFLNVLTAVVVAIGMILVVKYGWSVAYKSFLRNERISSVWGSPMWTIRMLVPIGASLMLFQSFSELIKNLDKWIYGEEQPSAVEGGAQR